MIKRDKGSVFLRKDGRWCGAVSLGREIGKPSRRKYVYGDTKNEVMAKLRKTLETANPLRFVTNEITVCDYLDLWLDTAVKSSCAESTYGSCRDMVSRYITPHVGHIRLSTFTIHDGLELLSIIEDAGGSVATRKQVHVTAHWAFGQAVRWGLISRNPWKHIPRPKPVTREIRVLSPDEIATLLTAAESSRLYALFVMAVTTGMRYGEIVGLHWSDINWSAKTVSVQRAVSDIRGKAKIAPLKTVTSKRSVMLPQFTIECLLGHRNRMQAEGHKGNLVFVNRAGRFLTRANFHKTTFKPLLKRAGLPDIPFHDLRHTAITLLLSLNVHPKIAAERSGHASAATTINTYSHLVPSAQESAVDSFAGLLKSLGD